MPLSQTQKSLIEKARNVGNSDMAVPIDDAAVSYLLARVVHDLGIQGGYPDVPDRIPPFFETTPVSSLRLIELDADEFAGRLFTSTPDSDTYFSCLAKLLKARLKFERILERQPFPTMDQVGPRGLLQHGVLSPTALAALLFWRKWLFDIDNRAAQETGYLFEPILAAALGGVAVSATRSPIRRASDAAKGRQVDCIKGNAAYEFKLRVTIAASGQGRWGQELSFPRDCANSNYTPVLVVLDATENTKLEELLKAFDDAGGRTYVGDAAWEMLEAEAGPVMKLFIERYVQVPLRTLLSHTSDSLPNLSLAGDGKTVTFTIGDESLTIKRVQDGDMAGEESTIPDDVDEALPGV